MSPPDLLPLNFKIRAIKASATYQDSFPSGYVGKV